LASYPALDVQSPATDNFLALIDDLGPTAVEERGDSTRLFFASADARNLAHSALGAARYSAAAIDVDDENWARRSQENLEPVTVGRITVAAPWAALGTSTRRPAPRTAPDTQHLAPGTIVILPSMGFGTGHHATTRLCLRGLQAVTIANRIVLDVGTGSGVLAIAAAYLGAARALGIDCDPDAIQAANENLGLNSVDSVEFRVADLRSGGLPAADVITANLTSALLVRSAGLLLGLLRPAGTLIVSGLLEEERDDVVRACAGPGKVRPTPEVPPTPEVGRTLSGPPTLMALIWEHQEDGWVALAMKRS
jgi:ribosomal protein L11 methyltransferase